jgi:hypothetical protein
MADEPTPEERRRALNARRWRLAHPAERAALMDALAESDPALHAELTALRATAPQAWRKRLIAEAKRRGMLAGAPG